MKKQTEENQTIIKPSKKALGEFKKDFTFNHGCKLCGMNFQSAKHDDDFCPVCRQYRAAAVQSVEDAGAIKDRWGRS